MRITCPNFKKFKFFVITCHYMHYIQLHMFYIKITYLLHKRLHAGCKITVITVHLRSNYDSTLVPPIFESGGYLLYMKNLLYLPVFTILLHPACNEDVKKG